MRVGASRSKESSGPRPDPACREAGFPEAQAVKLMDKGQGLRPRCGPQVGEVHSSPQKEKKKKLPQALPTLLGKSLGPHSLGTCLARYGSGATGTRERGKGDSTPESLEQP